MPSSRILIVDDDEGPLKAWARALRLSGYNVSTARSAQEAIALCQENSFDLALIDFLMPSMTGVELLQRIRKQLPLIRSIIVSGKLDKTVEPQEILETLKEPVEADVYLHKPVSNDRLREHVKELLTKSVGDPDWRDIARKALAAKKASIRKAKSASGKLRRLAKKKK